MVIFEQNMIVWVIYCEVIACSRDPIIDQSQNYSLPPMKIEKQHTGWPDKIPALPAVLEMIHCSEPMLSFSESVTSQFVNSSLFRPSFSLPFAKQNYENQQTFGIREISSNKVSANTFEVTQNYFPSLDITENSVRNFDSGNTNSMTLKTVDFPTYPLQLISASSTSKQNERLYPGSTGEEMAYFALSVNSN